VIEKTAGLGPWGQKPWENTASPVKQKKERTRGRPGRRCGGGKLPREGPPKVHQSFKKILTGGKGKLGKTGGEIKHASKKK